MACYLTFYRVLSMSHVQDTPIWSQREPATLVWIRKPQSPAKVLARWQTEIQVMSPSWPRLTVPPSLLNTIIHSGAEEGFPEKTIAWMGKLWEIGWHSSIKQLSRFYLHLITLARQLIRSPCFSLFFPSQACDLQLLKNMHLSVIGQKEKSFSSLVFNTRNY